MKWISVKDKWPDESWVLGTDGAIVLMGFFDEDNVFVSVTDLVFVKDVTHWMYLPKPPKDSK